MMEEIFKLLSQHDFTITNNDSEYFKCIICGRIITNACQTVCGCNFCHKCVDECVKGGKIFCPGITEECKTEHLSNVSTDHKMNRQISQLVVRCPAQTCGFECQLRIMGEHLRLCPKRSVECPFNDVGCDRGKLALDQLEEHLQQKSLRHNEILIEVIGNLRNDNAALKRDGEKYRSDIDRLVQCDTEKGAIIDSMKEEIRSIKSENAAMAKQMENLLKGKCDKTAMEIDPRCMQEKIDSIDEQLKEMRREWSSERDRMAVIDAEREKEKEYRKEMTERIDSVEKYLTVNINKADFTMAIDNITEWRKINNEKCSEYFKVGTEPYKMRLQCYPSYYIGDDQLRIHLCIYAGESDGSLRWPFERNITITITHQMHPQIQKSVTNDCKIAKPPNNEYKSSPALVFKWSELFDGGVVENACLTVQCFIRDG